MRFVKLVEFGMSRTDVKLFKLTTYYVSTWSWCHKLYNSTDFVPTVSNWKTELVVRIGTTCYQFIQTDVKEHADMQRQHVSNTDDKFEVCEGHSARCVSMSPLS